MPIEAGFCQCDYTIVAAMCFVLGAVVGALLLAIHDYFMSKGDPLE